MSLWITRHFLWITCVRRAHADDFFVRADDARRRTRAGQIAGKPAWLSHFFACACRTHRHAFLRACVRIYIRSAAQVHAGIGRS